MNAIHVYFAERARTADRHLTQCYAGITGGQLGIESVIWFPTSTALLLLAHAGIQIFVWDLKSQSVQKVISSRNSKTSAAFSPDQSTLAVLTRENDRDLLVTVDARSLEPTQSIALRTLDSSIVKWSPDSVSVLVIDSISQHLMELVNVKTKNTRQHSAYDGYLGISEAESCPNAKIIGVGGFDDYVRLLVAPEWKVLAEFYHETSLRSEGLNIFVESDDHFTASDPPFDLPQSSTTGITHIKWAVGNRLLATISARTPSGVFLWNTETVSLIAAIVCRSDVTYIEWSPVDEILAVGSGSGFVALWTLEGVTTILTPESVRVLAFEWRSDGRQLAVIDNEAGTFAIADRYG
jgi:WD40 repeat protein